MKKKLLTALIFALAIITSPMLSLSQVPNQIISGLKSGDAKMVAQSFNDNIELVVLDRESICSQAQGEQILKDFFSKNKPKEFKITHEGGEDSPYAIGKMQTANGNFRIYFLLKSKSGKAQIMQLRIEKD